jgi:hypothetical protein
LQFSREQSNQNFKEVSFLKIVFGDLAIVDGDVVGNSQHPHQRMPRFPNLKAIDLREYLESHRRGN